MDGGVRSRVRVPLIQLYGMIWWYMVCMICMRMRLRLCVYRLFQKLILLAVDLQLPNRILFDCVYFGILRL